MARKRYVGATVACSGAAADVAGTPSEQYVGGCVSITALLGASFERAGFYWRAIQHAHEYLYKHATNLRILVE
jgi:hypothetical protein